MKIGFPPTQGIAGAVFQSRQKINLTDPYSDPRFDSAWDKRSGFRTVSILAVPMLDSAGRCIGVMQVLNKTSGGRFDAHDEKLLEAFSSQAAVTLENAVIVGELHARREAENGLTAELAANHEKLQEAFNANEAQKTSLEAAIRKVRVIRNISIGFVAVIFVSLGLYLWFDNLGDEGFSQRWRAREWTGHDQGATAARRLDAFARRWAGAVCRDQYCQSLRRPREGPSLRVRPGGQEGAAVAGTRSYRRGGGVARCGDRICEGP